MKKKTKQKETKKKAQEEVVIEKENQEAQEVEIQGEDAQIKSDGEEAKEDGKEETSQLQEEIELLKAQKEELENQLLRQQAEFTNFRKRKVKESEESIRYANISFMKSLLPIFDNLDRSLKAIQKADNMAAVEEGVGIIESYTQKQFKKLGIEVIESTGKTFDVELHEAISAIPVEEEEKKGIVIDEVEKGYKLKDKIIRFSKVIVGE